MNKILLFIIICISILYFNKVNKINNKNKKKGGNRLYYNNIIWSILLILVIIIFISYIISMFYKQVKENIEYKQNFGPVAAGINPVFEEPWETTIQTLPFYRQKYPPPDIDVVARKVLE